MKVIAFLIIVLITLFYLNPVERYRTESFCKPSKTSTPYCKYKGKIKKYYINTEGLLLVFLNKDFDLSSAQSYGYSVKSGNVMAVNLGAGPYHEKMYESIISAFNNDTHIEIHSRDTVSEYMKIDRIWLSKQEY